MLINPLNLTNDQLMDRASCFELFRKSYRKNQALEENKELLKEKYAIGKELGIAVNNSRNAINRIKNEIEELRKERALLGMVNNENDVIKHPDEDRLTNEIKKQKRIYKESFDGLKDLKAEIERIQVLLERNRDRMQKDFEKWVEVMMTQRSVLTNAPSTNTQHKIAPSVNLNKSGMSQTTTVTTMTQKENNKSVISTDVQNNLAAFYKARNEIYNQVQNSTNS